jgi:hypothetical protein
MTERNRCFYLKIHHSILDSESLLVASSDIRLAWFLVLLLGSSSNRRGYFTTNIKAITRRTHLDPRKVKKALDFFLSEDMIEPDGDLFRIVNWDKYQTGESTERTRKYRGLPPLQARSRNVTGTVTGTVPERIDRDLDRDRDKPPYPPSALAPSGGGPASGGNGEDDTYPPEDTPEQRAATMRMLKEKSKTMFKAPTLPPRTDRGEKY